MDRQAAPDAPRMKFVDGELTGLRPVLATDLEAVVHLLNESPLPFAENIPWTVPRLKKKFEDEKEPGLWSDTKRWYVVVDLANEEVCGLLKDGQRGGEVGLKLHFANSHPRRRLLLLDALRTYVRFKDGFSQAARVNAEFVDVDDELTACLLAAGFIPQIRVPGVCMHLGERRDYVLYSWIPQWVLDRRAPDGGAKE